jgi:iron(III) transport system substrate-binding protein
MLLEERGVLAAYSSPSAAAVPQQFRNQGGSWSGTAGRARVLIVNTHLVPRLRFPESVQDLLDPGWPADKLALSSPLFGTSLTHAAALYAAWGPQRAREFFRRLQNRGVGVVPGNSVVRDLVVQGRIFWGVTDTDDAAVAIARGAPVEVVFPDQGAGQLGTLVIPNTIGVVAGAPHGDQARRLVDYLLGPEVESRLVKSGWCHVPLRHVGVRPQHFDSEGVQRMDVAPAEIYRHLDVARRDLREIFVQ